jgi:anti-anti-sigma regulatory factor
MLRVSVVAADGSSVTLKLEGRIAREWVAVLEAECRRALTAQQRLRLDLADVTYIDPAGARMLRGMCSAGVEICHCAPLIRQLLHGEHEP